MMLFLILIEKESVNLQWTMIALIRWLLMKHWFWLAVGGDDVQQLCEAGEEEFLEIMALVGMASKPLHVRRLQKALQEFVQNPGKDHHRQYG